MQVRIQSQGALVWPRGLCAERNAQRTAFGARSA